MRLIASDISSHRLQRLLVWALHWCVRILQALAYLTPRDAKPPPGRALGHIRRIVAMVIFLNAARRCNPPPPRRTGRPHNTPHGFRAPAARNMRRAVIGSALRRRLRGRTLEEQACAILRVLNGVEHAIAALARRLAKRLTRLVPLVASAPPEARLRVVSPESACAAADTS